MDDVALSTESEQRPGVREYLAVAARRRKPMLLTAGICAVLAILLALLLPAHYRSTATILIEQQELPSDLVRSTVTSYADQRVQVISQRVMTTQNLLDIIRRYGLYPREQQRESREELIGRMRDDIDFRMISADVIDPRSGVPREATIAFSVSYTSRSPAEAVKVANELTTLYLSENLTERTRLAQDAATFLTVEGDRHSRRIAELEGKLATFKEKNLDALPELTAINMQLMDRTEQELRQAQSRQTSLEQQRVYLEAQLAQLKPNGSLVTDGGERILSPSDRLKVLRSQLASARAVYAPDHPDIARLQREVAGLEAQAGDSNAGGELTRQLDRAQGELAAARQRYSDTHPDVQRLEREVESLRTELASEAARPVSTAPTIVPDNPAYIQIQAQLSATQNDLSALTREMGAIRKRLADYQQRISTSPMIEKDYRELARDYENAQRKYQEIRSKQEEAVLAQNLESDRKGERFTLIEPPLPPEEPISPNRPLILILGLVLSIGLAVGAAALLEALDGTVRGRQDLALFLDGPPLALIPQIATALDVRAGLKRLRVVAGAASASAVAMLLAVHFLYRPLDVLWFAVLNRVGL